MKDFFTLFKQMKFLKRDKKSNSSSTIFAIFQGYCFVEYPSKEIADTAVQLLDGHVLDKNHTFAAYNMIEIRNIKEPDPDWKPPTAKPYVDVVSFVI